MRDSDACLGWGKQCINEERGWIEGGILSFSKEEDNEVFLGEGVGCDEEVFKYMEISPIRNLKGFFKDSSMEESLDEEDMEREDLQDEDFLILGDVIALKEKRTLPKTKQKIHKIQVGECQQRG